MPRLSNSLPKYRKHKSGQAVVTIAGQDHYLGKHGTKPSRAEYDCLVGEWIAAGRPSRAFTAPNEITVIEICTAYWKFVRGYYVKNGRPTDQQAGIKSALRRLKEVYGKTEAADFGSLALKVLQARMIGEEISRTYINNNIDHIKIHGCFGGQPRRS